MTSTRSDEAVQGSVGSGSDSKQAPDPSYASTRVHHYCQDSTSPVNVHLSLASSSQLGSSREGTHLGVVGSIGNVLDSREPTSSPAEVPASATNHAKASDELRGVGTHFGDPDIVSSSQGSNSSA